MGMLQVQRNRNELVFNDNFLDLISLLDRIDHLETVDNLPKTGMFPVQVAGVGPGVADKKLRSPCIPTSMCH